MERVVDPWNLRVDNTTRYAPSAFARESPPFFPIGGREYRRTRGTFGQRPARGFA